MINEFFSDTIVNKAMLSKYGLDSWPTEHQLATLVFDLDEKYSALFAAIGYKAKKMYAVAGAYTISER